MAEDWKTRIFQQKSLWEVYRISSSILPKPTINRVIFWLFVLLFVGFFVWGVYDGGKHYTAQDAVKFLRISAGQGLSLAVGILGFLIAGFAIFASVTRAELFITLANIRYKETDINRLQFVFFNFINVFTVYMGLLAISLSLSILLAEGSPLLRLGGVFVLRCPQATAYALFLILGVLGLWIVSAILKLKSFIWNLYQTVLVAIATEAELQERRGQGRS